MLAFGAGVVAAGGLCDLAGALHARPRAPRRRGRRLRAALVGLGRRLGAPAPPGDLAARLRAAGAPLSPGDAMALKAGAALTGLLTALPLAAGAPGRLGLLLPLAGAVAGFLALDGALLLRTRRRAATIAVELPDVLDLLRVAIEAGLPPGRALAEVGRRHGGLLARELRRAAARGGVGATRDDVLEDLLGRAPTAGVAALVTVLRRADRLGAPAGEALAALARDAREGRARARAEAAAKAAPKIQLVVALLLVPSVMALVARGAGAGAAEGRVTGYTRAMAVTAESVPAAEAPELRRVIGRKTLLVFVVGDVLGAGIYALVGEVGAETGGAIWTAFTLALLLAIFTAFAYAELVTKYPRAAGAALYVNKAFRIPFVSSWSRSRSCAPV